MQKKKYFFRIFLIIFIVLSPIDTYAAEIPTEKSKELFEKQLDMLEFEEIQRKIEDSEMKGFSFKDTIIKVVDGSINLSPKSLLIVILKRIFKEIYVFGGLMRDIIIISIFSALLKNLTESFKNKAVGELGFYVCYIVLITIIFRAFLSAVSLTQGLIGSLTGLIEASVPLIITLLVVSGNVSAPYIFSPALSFATTGISVFIGNFLTPIIILGAIVQIINSLTEKEMLSNFAELIKSFCTWVLNIVAVMFLAVLALQKVSSPILNNLAGKTAKAAVGVIPVVGGVINGATDMLLYWASAAKSGSLVAIIIVIAGICFVPIIKLAALMLILKLTGAVVQPISDKRIVTCLNSISSFSALLLYCCIIVTIMFLLTVIILLSF